MAQQSLLSLLLYLFFLSVCLTSFINIVSGQAETEGEGEGENSESESSEGESEGSSSSTSQYSVSTSCSYIWGEDFRTPVPLDTCISTYIASESSSYEYVCNDDGDEVYEYLYDVVECDGTGTLNNTYDREGDNDTVSFRCDGSDCAVLIKLHQNVTEECDSYSDYYVNQAYVESVCATETVTRDDEEETISSKYSCDSNSTITFRIYTTDDCSVDGGVPLTKNFADGCNFDDGQPTVDDNGTILYNGTWSFSDHLICYEAPTASPTVADEEEDASMMVNVHSMVVLCGIVATLFVFE